jgi:hypothetical protein
MGLFRKNPLEPHIIQLMLKNYLAQLIGKIAAY